MMQQIDFKNDVVGKIYAIDTAGGILGVLAAIHLLLPFFGIKLLMIIAGSLDILIGILFFLTQTKFRKPQFLVLSFTGFFFLILTAILFINPDSQKMASGVFRYGNIGHSKNFIFEKDGKTASIAVFETQKGNIVLTTNGKPDASVNIYRQITGDEATQVLLAALPLSFNYQPEKVGIIGLGCGKTAHTVLTNFNIRQLDVVEIEPVVYEAAVFFKDYVRNIFIDSRFNLHINDARTFFSITKNQYDLIISEPSNPWVSGVGSLFSIEFYDLISKKLNDNGIFVQWVQSYEMTVPLVASIVKSFSPFFQDYEVFFMDDGDLAFVCKKSGNLHVDYSEIFENIELKHELARIGIENSNDFKIRLIGNKAILEPFFNSYSVSANSDFYPFLEYQTAKAGFLQLSASSIEQLISFPAPIIYSLMKTNIPEGELVGLNPPYQMGERFRHAEAVFLFFKDKNEGLSPDYKNLDEESVLLINTIRLIENRNDSLNFSISWTPFLSTFAKVVQPFLPGEKLDVIWNYIQNADGFPFLPEKIKQQVEFYQAVGNRNYEKIIDLSNKTSFDDISLAFPDKEYYFACRIWAFLMLSKQEEAIKLWENYPYKSNPSMILRLLGNLTEKRVDSIKTHSETPNLLK
jgi:spermidine synthase